MNIHRVQTGSPANAAAVQTSKTTNAATTTATTQAADSAAKATPAAAFGVKGDDVNPRLAAYQDKVSARIEHALKNENLSERQRYALQTAQSKFQSMIQRLDEAYSSDTANADKRPIKAGLQHVMQMISANFNHVTSGGNVDVKG